MPLLTICKHICIITCFPQKKKTRDNVKMYNVYVNDYMKTHGKVTNRDVIKFHIPNVILQSSCVLTIKSQEYSCKCYKLIHEKVT